MTRSRNSAKHAGTAFETLEVRYWQKYVSDLIERRRLSGAADRGDMSGIRHYGKRLVAELKEYGGSVNIGAWLNETEKERGNDDALAGFVIAKRNRHVHPGDQIVIMTVRDLIAILTLVRPPETGSVADQGEPNGRQ